MRQWMTWTATKMAMLRCRNMSVCPPPHSLSHTHTHTHCPFHPPLPHSPLPPSLSSELDTQYAVWFAEDIWPQYERDVADEEPEWLSEEKNHFTTHRFPTHSIAHPFT